jgi:hypothetical protein
MLDFPDYALVFGEQACVELEQARLLMPRRPLPVATLAGVYERLGWAHYRADRQMHASDDFRSAVKLWRTAEDFTRDDSGPEDDAKLVILVDRRLKAQLESNDPILQREALADLKSVATPAALLRRHVWLYNRSCLYAQASKADPYADYQQQALYWLGLALVRNHDSSLWDYAAHSDPELAPIRRMLGPFLGYLRDLIPLEPTRAREVDADALVARALAHTASQQ